MSTRTGLAPTRDTQPAVAKNEYVGVMTSSPCVMSSVISASRIASVPDDTASACLTPSIAASSRSSASTSGPMMKRWLSATRVIAARISSRSGRYCACRSSNGTFMGPTILSSCFDGRARLAIDLAALDRFALVVFLFALGEADGNLHAAVLVIQPHGDQRHALFDGLANQLSDLVAVQQQLAAPQRFVIRVSAMAVGADVDVVEKDLAVLEACEAVAQIHAALADRFHLGAQQHDPRFERFEEVVIVERLSVLGDRGLRFLALGLIHGHDTRHEDRFVGLS